MSSYTPHHHPPIPRQPLGATFITAISLLGAVAAVQFIAVIAHYLPDFRKSLADTSLRAQEVQQAPTPQAASPQTSSTAAAPPVPAGDLQRAKKLFDEANQGFRIGDYDATMKKLDEIEVILPGDPAVLQLKSLVYERQGQMGVAIEALEGARRYPGLPPQDLDRIEKKIAQLRMFMNSGIGGDTAPSRPVDSMGTTENIADGPTIRDPVGLPAGADLGIIDIRVKEGKPDTKSLQVSVKSRPGKAIGVQDVKILVYFYEESMDGEVDLTKSKVVSEWLSPPVNWADNEPELLSVQYLLSPDDKAEGRKYHGYVMGVYYNGELQDFRAEPSELAKNFPLPLLLKE